MRFIRGDSLKEAIDRFHTDEPLKKDPGRRSLEFRKLLRRAQRGEFPAPRRLDPSIDEALEAVCLKAMATRPEDRYATPRLLAEEGASGSSSEGPAPSPRALANPQSTTSVSPCRPTMILPGLMSRCRTPRLWA